MYSFQSLGERTWKQPLSKYNIVFYEINIFFTSIYLSCPVNCIEYDEYSLGMKSAYLEVLSDTLGSVGVIAAGVIILTTRFYIADSLNSTSLAVV